MATHNKFIEKRDLDFVEDIVFEVKETSVGLKMVGVSKIPTRPFRSFAYFKTLRHTAKESIILEYCDKYKLNTSIR